MGSKVEYLCSVIPRGAPNLYLEDWERLLGKGGAEIKELRNGVKLETKSGGQEIF